MNINMKDIYIALLGSGKHIKGKYIGDNTILCWSILDWNRKENPATKCQVAYKVTKQGIIGRDEEFSSYIECFGDTEKLK